MGQSTETSAGLAGLRIDANSGEPVYRQIAEGIRDAARAGKLAAGTRLPPTRDLARQLGVNRNTVVAAYDLLAAEGVVHSHTGRGTFVAAQNGAAPAVLAGAPDTWSLGFSQALERPGVGNLLSVYNVGTSQEGISFAGSYPAADLMPVDAFRKAFADELRERGAEVLSYGPSAGWGPLREAIAAEMRRAGSRVGSGEILVTSGSQQGLELIFRALLDPGDPIVIEDPTYTGALSALASLGARLVGVPLDDDGVRPDLLELAIERHRARLVYLQPSHHNPTTRVLSEPRRREVLDIARRHGCAIVEDDWAKDLRFDGPQPPSLHALDGGARVIYVSTYSKKLLPGLRIGWVCAPAPVLDRLVALKQIEDCGTSPLLQAALHRFVREGRLDEHLRRVRRAYAERRDAMIGALGRHIPPGASWERPAGGLFLWLQLPAGLDSDELFGAAQRRGVLFSRGQLFHVDGNGGRDALRLTFAAASTEQIEAGVKVLGELVRERAGSAAGPAVRRAAETVPIL
ncbi:MAG: PLP-dependent aminotransferase family protein [Acidobacteria bacterium]|nr:PLP-dependent aminotransferase family protein [Acidobacteriota bacterium]